jgi:hypothetical protein
MPTPLGGVGAVAVYKVVSRDRIRPQAGIRPSNPPEWIFFSWAPAAAEAALVGHDQIEN